jgi:two-component system OmpR family response regulator
MIKLLLIEDDMVCANLVKHVLQMNGFEVFHASDALMGLRGARDYNPDAILLDLNLPDLDGKMVALQLRKSPRWAETPIIAFTGQANSKTRRLALGFGCDEMISKSDDFEELPHQLLAIIETRTHPNLQ